MRAAAIPLATSTQRTVGARLPERASRPELFDATGFLDDLADSTAPRTPLVTAFYRVKPHVPRWLQLAARRGYAARQARRATLGWPIEPALVAEQQRRIAAELARRGAESVPVLNLWPDGCRFAFILTHDVEGPAGIANIDRVLEVERRHGLVSSWYVVAEDYDIPADLFPRLRAAGCEVGLHGVTHDCSLFSSRRQFDAQLPRIHRYLREWGAVGFRSPALHRNAAWMPELGCVYDSSYPDTDPFQPQPGGCRSVLPFFLGELLELPLTLVQDHTLFEILRRCSSDLWIEKSDWLIEHHGLVNVLVHPDYLLEQERLDVYEELLTHLVAQPGGWPARACDVAAWWRVRAALSRGHEPPADVDGAEELARRATVAHARIDGGRLIFDPSPVKAGDASDRSTNDNPEVAA
jgi:peptidoglycan/xylan/chitin deacetylase (PgdA/CDA1 family)